MSVDLSQTLAILCLAIAGLLHQWHHPRKP